MRASLLALAWLGFYYLLAQYGALLLPRAVAQETTLPQYLAMVQIVSVLGGVTVLLLGTSKEPSLRAAFFPELAIQKRTAKVRLLSVALLLAPLTFLTAYSLGMYLAFDTLLAELAARGARAVQAQTGELGRTAKVDTLWTILPFTVVLAPLGEELLFRGGVYGAIDWLAQKSPLTQANEDELPPSIEVAGVPRGTSNLSERVRSFLGSGGLALLGSSLLFGVMHADTEGGMGIVRVTSASVLGVVCGGARMLSGGLSAPLIIHAGYNFISLAALRGWLVFEGWPTKYAIPTALVPFSVVCTTLALLAFFVGKRRRPKS